MIKRILEILECDSFRIHNSSQTITGSKENANILLENIFENSTSVAHGTFEFRNTEKEESYWINMGKFPSYCGASCLGNVQSFHRLIGKEKFKKFISLLREELPSGALLLCFLDQEHVDELERAGVRITVITRHENPRTGNEFLMCDIRGVD